MTKNIDTLIPDIYAMLEEGVDTDKEDMQKFLNDFASQVREAASIILQEGKREGKTNLRLSQIGKPDRQIWFGVNGVEGQPIDGQTRIKFLMGHLLEAVLILLTKSAGHSVEGEQDEVNKHLPTGGGAQRVPAEESVAEARAQREHRRLAG